MHPATLRRLAEQGNVPALIRRAGGVETWLIDVEALRAHVAGDRFSPPNGSAAAASGMPAPSMRDREASRPEPIRRHELQPMDNAGRPVAGESATVLGQEGGDVRAQDDEAAPAANAPEGTPAVGGAPAAGNGGSQPAQPATEDDALSALRGMADGASLTGSGQADGAPEPVQVTSLVDLSLDRAVALERYTHSLLAPLIDLLREREAAIERREAMVRHQAERIGRLEREVELLQLQLARAARPRRASRAAPESGEEEPVVPRPSAGQPDAAESAASAPGGEVEGGASQPPEVASQPALAPADAPSAQRFETPSLVLGAAPSEPDAAPSGAATAPFNPAAAPLGVAEPAAEAPVATAALEFDSLLRAQALSEQVQRLRDDLHRISLQLHEHPATIRPPTQPGPSFAPPGLGAAAPLIEPAEPGATAVPADLPEPPTLPVREDVPAAVHDAIGGALVTDPADGFVLTGGMEDDEASTQGPAVESAECAIDPFDEAEAAIRELQAALAARATGDTDSSDDAGEVDSNSVEQPDEHGGGAATAGVLTGAPPPPPVAAQAAPRGAVARLDGPAVSEAEAEALRAMQDMQQAQRRSMGRRPWWRFW